MHLKELSIFNYKICSTAELHFCDGVNCFTGNNGEGKTNFLDAIYYLSFCKSFFNPIDSQNVQRDTAFFMLKGEYDRNDANEVVQCSVKVGQKKQFKRNKKEYQKLAEHIGLFPLVMISPSDIALVLDGSEVRRKFIDAIISQYNKQYLDDLLSYNRVLLQRNSLLKHFAKERNFDKVGLDVYNEQLAQYGTAIFNEREVFLKNFIVLFQRHYNYIASEKETISLEYQSHLHEGDFIELLNKTTDRDRALCHTSVGVHKDDLLFTISDFPVKKFASQGQQKSYLVALKLAQFEYIKEIKKVKPIILLDDIFDKLDLERAKRIMHLISDHQFGQIFITDTNLERIEDLFKEINIEQKYFNVIQGEATNAKG
jgi:DNA replication and repair protein RecF